MSRELLVPADYGFPFESGSIDADADLLDDFISQVLPLFGNDSASIGKEASQSAIVPIAVEVTNIEANKRKEEFINILLAWDKEHDNITEKAKSHKPRGRLFRDKNDLIAEVRSNILDTHSWKDVFDALRDAEQTYSNPTGIKVVHKWFRKAADKSDLIEPFVGFIPNSDFSSVICGGIKFILKACTASKKFREEAFDLINQLPEKVDITGQYLELYQNDAQLQGASYELFCNILSAIQSIMYWLMKDHTFEWLKPLLQQNSYNPLQERIKDVGKSSALVDRVIQLCNSKKLSEVADRVDNIAQDTAWFKKTLTAFFRGMLQHAKWSFAVQEYKDKQAGQTLQQKPEAIIPQKDLLLLLDPNAVAIKTTQEHILKQVLRTGFAMDTEAQTRVEWLMANKSISHWFTSSESQTLLVNGHGSLDRVTPMSLFCAMLAQSFSIGSIIVLSHFCGLQMPEADSQDSKGRKRSGLLQSLLIQLLAQWKLSEITCLKHDFVEKLKRTSPSWSLRQQKHLLRRLVAALPPAMPIFIIIDGTNYYETADLRDEIKEVVAEVNELLSLKSVEAMVKVLITSPTRSFNLTEYFETNEVVNVPEDIDDIMTRFSESKLRLQFDSKAASLERSLSRNRHR